MLKLKHLDRSLHHYQMLERAAERREAMTERPIPFNAPMVRAVLAGTKAQTRRVVKRQPRNDPAKHHPIEPYNNGRGGWNWVLAATGHGTGDPFRCPYGQPGDRLWVREAFIHEPADYCWEASVSIPCRPATTVYRADHLGDTRGAGWSPSIHMPRALSRITLEVTGVRVERLQGISTADCWAEGIASSPDVDPVHEYRDLWESINGPGSWDANPWVWVVEFQRIDAAMGDKS